MQLPIKLLGILEPVCQNHTHNKQQSPSSRSLVSTNVTSSNLHHLLMYDKIIHELEDYKKFKFPNIPKTILMKGIRNSDWQLLQSVPQELSLSTGTYSIH
jgi:hypothetical protein